MRKMAVLALLLLVLVFALSACSSSLYDTNQGTVATPTLSSDAEGGITDTESITPSETLTDPENLTDTETVE